MGIFVIEKQYQTKENLQSKVTLLRRAFLTTDINSEKMKNIIPIIIALALITISCKKEKALSSQPSYVEARINNVSYFATTFTTNPLFYNNQFLETTIEWVSDNQYLWFHFYQKDLKTGAYNFHNVHASDSSGITAAFCDLSEMINPEDAPIYNSIAGNINIYKIDTGTYMNNHGVIMNLRATFHFITDSIHGPSKTINEGEVYFHCQ